LSSPDLLFGFESEVGRRNIVGVAAAYPDIARQGVLLRKFGQEIIRATAGKRVHGTGSIPGGMNRHLAPEDQAQFKGDIDQIITWCQAAVDLVKRLHDADSALYDEFGTVRSGLASLVRADGALDLYDGMLRFRNADGHIVLDGVADHDYLQVLDEQVKPWSYMKFPHLRQFGPDLGWYKVGPLARVQNCDVIPSPLAEAERQEFSAYGGTEPIHATLAYHWARMIEMLHCAEVIRELLDDADLLSGELVAAGPRAREGVGVIEAPRGTLIHHYRVDDDDLVSWCNLIVSTTHNNQAMNSAVRSVARRYLNGRQLTEGLLNHIEVAIRAFDPCLSCATHALGKMPLVLELVEADGMVVEQVVRSH
jgi:NAD-reducing hydrogenase large subunit